MSNTLDMQRLMELVDDFEEADERALEAARVAFTPSTWNAESWQAVVEAFFRLTPCRPESDRLLHSKREDVLVSEDDALRCVEASNEMLEALFSA